MPVVNFAVAPLEYTDEELVLQNGTLSLDTDCLIDTTQKIICYTSDVPCGQVCHAIPPGLLVHYTFYYKKSGSSITIQQETYHLTFKLGSERCNVFSNGDCIPTGPILTFENSPSLETIRIAVARTSDNLQVELVNQGFSVHYEDMS